VLECQRLLLKGRWDGVCAMIGMNGPEVGVVITNRERSAAVKLAVTAQGASRLSLDKDDRIGTLVGVLPDGTPTVTCHDPHNRPRLTLSVFASGAFFSLWDQMSRRRVTAGHGVNGTSDLVLADRNETRRAVMGVPDDGVPLFAVYDDQALPRVFMGLDIDGNPELNLHGPDLLLLFSKP
jgi:hypothetical protein